MSYKENRTIKCTSCGSEDVSVAISQCEDYLSKNIFSVACCGSCGLVFTVIPKGVDVGDFYGSGYYNSESGKFWGLFESVFQFFHRRRAEYIERKFSPSKVLDVGCGQASMLAELARRGVNVMGVESNAASDWLLRNQSFEVIKYSRFTDLIDKENFGVQDVVVLWHVIEHLESPNETLLMLKRIMSKHSFLLISCPNFDSLQAKIFRRFWFHLDVPRHVTHYSKKSLSAQLNRLGFFIHECSRGDIYQDLFGCWQSVANAFSLGCNNSIYLLLQGSISFRFPSLIKLFAQLMSAPIWLPAGFLLFLIEVVVGRPGTITVFAKLKGDERHG